MGGGEWGVGGGRRKIPHSAFSQMLYPLPSPDTAHSARWTECKAGGIIDARLPSAFSARNETSVPINHWRSGRRRDASEGEGMSKCAKVSECAFARLTLYFVSIFLSFFLWPSARDEAISRSDKWRLSCAAADSESANAKRWCTCFVQVALHAENM